jgi:hypothetical protein
MNQPTYMAQIANALEFDRMSQEEQEDTMVEISNLIFQGTMIKVMELMSEEDKNGLFALEDSQASEESITEYINAHVPNSDSLVKEPIDDLVNDILAVTGG